MHTYIVEAIGTGTVKIGKAVDINKRLSGLQTGSPVELRVAASINEDIESDLHHKHAKARIRGEWFEITPDIVSLVNRLGGKLGGVPRIEPRATREDSQLTTHSIDLVAFLCRAQLGGETKVLRPSPNTGLEETQSHFLDSFSGLLECQCEEVDPEGFLHDEQCPVDVGWGISMCNDYAPPLVCVNLEKMEFTLIDDKPKSANLLHQILCCATELFMMLDEFGFTTRLVLVDGGRLTEFWMFPYVYGSDSERYQMEHGILSGVTGHRETEG